MQNNHVPSAPDGRTNKLHKLRTLHLFAGAGGGILGDILLGHQPVCAVEIDSYCQQVLHARQQDGILPWFPIFADVKEFDGKPWRGRVDIVCGGFPCQDISSAGKGAGIDGERSGLWGEMARTIREVGPRFVLVENSPLLASRGLGRVLRDLAEMGYDAKWGVLGNGDVSPDEVGERMWIAAKGERGGWPEILCRQKRVSESEGAKSTSPDDAYSQDWTPRLRALEDLVGEPAILGSRDGLANQVDRLKAIGNGQFPSVAALAWRILNPSTP
jgi:DNA (cytosine-5)-methyltransferase 1